MRFKHSLIIGLVIWLLSSFQTYGQSSIAVLNFNSFEPHLLNKNDTTYVINFWATWCLPCREEIPAFNQLEESYEDSLFKLLFVSLDFPGQVDKSLIPFIKAHKMKAKIVLLDDPNANSWINKVDPSWSGAIPATLIYNKNFRKFYEQSFTYPQLKHIVEQNLIRR